MDNLLKIVESDAMAAALHGLGLLANPFPKSNWLRGFWAAAYKRGEIASELRQTTPFDGVTVRRH